MSCGCDDICPNPVIPEGNPGEAGAAATVTVGSTTTLPPGSSATVSNSGTSLAAILDFGIPAGADGIAATIAVGTVTTVPFGDPATVSNSGTSAAAIFDFEIPEGDTGDSAYELAVAGGTFTGTLNQFNVSFWPKTTTTANFTVPAISASVTIAVVSTYQMVPGGYLYVQGTGWFLVGTVFSFTSVSITNPSGITNSAPGTIVASGAEVNAAGPQGATGPASTVPGPSINFLGGTLPPSGGLGVNGDVYLQQVNTGKWQVYVKSGGFWSAMASGYIIANRLIGTSTTTSDPNTLGIPSASLNAGDQYWTQIGSTVSMWTWTGVIWTVAFSFTTGGGGGSDTFTTVAANSVPGSYGQLTGTYNWELQRTIYWQPLVGAQTIDGATYQFNLAYQKNTLSITNNTVLNHTTLGGESEWTFEILNSAATTKLLTYSSGVWTVLPGVTYPTTLSPGERVQLICRKHGSKICIVNVIANVSTIP